MKQKLREARLRDGRIPALINGKHWLHVYTDRKTGAWKGGITPDRQRVYSTIEWKRAVKKVRKRDKNQCQRCSVDRSPGNEMDVHHIVSFEVEHLRTDPDNLVLLCEPCHYWVHSRENVKKLFLKEHTNEQHAA
jgi:hypothetical protein